MTIEVASKVVSFDLDDVNYLAGHLSAHQLRKEIHHTDVEQGGSLFLSKRLDNT